jgi:hypothetical protein
MPTTKRRIARTEHLSYCCGVGITRIPAGAVYLEHVAFPGDDGHEYGTQPIRLRECAACATRYGRAELLLPRAESRVPTGGTDGVR